MSEEAQFWQNDRPTAYNFNEKGTLSQAYFNVFSTDVEQQFCRRSPSGCF